MNTSYDGGLDSPCTVNSDTVREDPIEATIIGGGNDSNPRLESGTVGSAETESRVSAADGDESVQPKGSDNLHDSGGLKPESDGARIVDGSGGALQNEVISSFSRGRNINKKKHSGKSERKKVKTGVEGYDSILSEFDRFASKRAGEAVGYRYEFGDMVWGKVKSHPWWPGYIYSEALASSSVRKTKRTGHMLVAFFGDSSYGWFDLTELVPFEENFAEKSRQTSLRSFVKAVEEAVDEFSRRWILGLACRCRNQFNFRPSNVEGYFIVEGGDNDPEVYSSRQINKARESFQPNEILSFVQQLALTPMDNQQETIEFIKNRAMVLACRKAQFEEFDETYAQAFGTISVSNRPTMPVAVDPAKAPLRGPLVMAEAFDRGKISTKPTKAKGRAEKDKYEFKRRDETTHMNIKKTSSSEDQSGYSIPPLLVDGSPISGASIDSGIQGNDNRAHSTTHPSSLVVDVKPSEGSRKNVEGGIKKAKIHKPQAVQLSAESASSVEKKKKKKRKKETSTEQVTGELSVESVTPVGKKQKNDASTEQIAAGELNTESVTRVDKNSMQLPPDNSSSELAVEKVSGMPSDVLSTAKNQHDNLSKDVVMVQLSSPPPIEPMQPVNKELSILVRDLRSLALDPSHGLERSCPSLVLPVFLKFRSLVYQKSLALSPSENDKSVARTTAALLAPILGNKDGHKSKLVKPPVRPDDPTRSGKKRGPSDHSEPVKKKKLISSEDIDKRKKLIGSDGIKKKKIIGDVKSTSVEKKIPQRPMESQSENVKVNASKSSSTLPKPVNPQPSKKVGRIPSSPTMLVMKFPTGAALPSGAELRAKFTRFGPMDHSATRVFWKTHTCRLVFHQKADAQAALKFAVGSSSLFGNTDVRSYTREVEVEPAEPQPVKLQKEDTLLSHNAAAVQLKSCLKKPNEESGNGNDRGANARVKFILGSDGSLKNRRLSSMSSADNPSPPPPSSSPYTPPPMDVSSSSSSKKLSMLIPESILGPVPSHQFQRANNIKAPPSSIELQSQSGTRPYSRNAMTMPKPTNNDISQQLLNLLTRCSDVVNNITDVLGYVPYHSL